MNKRVRLFVTGLLQVYLVAINTVFLSHYFYLGVGIVGFLISFVWCFNIGRIVVGDLYDKVIYSVAAGIGSLLGLLTTTLFL